MGVDSAGCSISAEKDGVRGSWLCCGTESRITHRAAFRFKWENGRERFFVKFSQILSKFFAERFVVEARSCRGISARFFAQELA